jgi:serine/threonine protein kinase/Tol biopolymer transport system component
MPLTIGTRLGPYEIVSLLGEGGMGQVYRARDTKLNRDVALKILPDAFANDADRLARFTREAQTLAALNHPHIAHIHGLDESGACRALVMELVEGEDLAQRLVRGAIPVPEALAIARQIAEALEAAHEQGIVHRDLKPANIKIRPDGTVKVLDFGLAKAVDPRASSPGMAALANSPTITSPAMMTGAGVILGTAAYMSPEQARGRPVDKRADIWAFGCVLYEMLTGRAVFEGATVSDVMARVIERDPDWSALPPATPPGVRRALQKCLEKDLKRRLRDIGDLELALDTAPDVTRDRAVRGGRSSWLGWAAAAVAFVAAGAVSAVHFRETPPVLTPVRFEMTTGLNLPESEQFSISPDGRHVVFAGAGPDGATRLWVRSLDGLDTRPLTVVDNDIGAIPPVVWSPDSRSFAFDNRGRLSRLDISGGQPQTVCDLPGVAVGGSWNRDGVILVGNITGGILRCPAAGGRASQVTSIDSSRKESFHLVPSFLPDGRHFLYLRSSRAVSENTGIFVGSLDAKPEEQSTSPLLSVEIGPAYYVPTPGSTSGHVLFPRTSRLFALPFDPQGLMPLGDPVPVVDHVGSYRDTAFFSASRTGVLVYRAADPDLQLTWFDRQGNITARPGDAGRYRNLALSVDGASAALARENPQNPVDQDLWVIDLSRGTSMRLTFDPSVDEAPVWTEDGRRIVYLSNGFKLVQKAANGTGAEQLVLGNDGWKRPTSVSLDGRFLLYSVQSLSQATKSDLWVLPLSGDPKPVPFVQDEFDDSDGQFSPDARWVAYVTNESGGNNVFVRAFSGDVRAGSTSAGGKVLVSKGGGAAPRWRRDGKELFYVSASGAVMAVDIDTSQGIKSGVPRTLFKVDGALADWGVSPDGSRFLFAVPAKQSGPAPFSVVLNWQATLKR